jgi:hypothetical protein
MEGGGMAEWFKAAVLKKSELPHFNESQREGSFFVYHFESSIRRGR